MLLLLTGTSGAGKTTLLAAVAGDLAGVAVHDFDEIGVPSGADARWRQRANEEWLQRAVHHQERGRDLLLAGQTPLGELLAAPSAVRVDGIVAALLECPEAVRASRLRDREGPDGWPGARLRDHDGWAAWLRAHAVDPQHVQHAVRSGAEPGLQWQRWEEWQCGDPRWDVAPIDAVGTRDQVAARALAWVTAQRRRHREGALGLAGPWWE